MVFIFCLFLFWTLSWSKCDDEIPPSYSGTWDFIAVYLVPAFPGVKPASIWCHFFGWLGPRCDQAALSDQEDLHSDFLKWFVFSLAWALPADGRYLWAGAEVTCPSFTLFVDELLALLSHLSNLYLLTCLQLNLFNWGKSNVLHESLELTQNTVVLWVSQLFFERGRGETWLCKSALKV